MNINLNIRTGYHVKNREESDLIMRYLERKGVRWVGDDKPTSRDMYHVYESETTYVVHGRKLQYGTKSTCLDLGIKVIEVSSLLPLICDSDFLRI